MYAHGILLGIRAVAESAAAKAEQSRAHTATTRPCSPTVTAAVDQLVRFQEPRTSVSTHSTSDIIFACACNTLSTRLTPSRISSRRQTTRDFVVASYFLSWSCWLVECIADTRLVHSECVKSFISRPARYVSCFQCISAVYHMCLTCYV